MYCGNSWGYKKNAEADDASLFAPSVKRPMKNDYKPTNRNDLISHMKMICIMITPYLKTGT